MLSANGRKNSFKKTGLWRLRVGFDLMLESPNRLAHQFFHAI
jgi:hypothetical protein